MSFDPEFMQLLRETFRAELADQLQQITDGLLRLEKGVAGDARQDVLNNVFRCAHNIKGAARGIDATHIADLAHQIESLFSAFRSGRPVEPALIDLSLQAVDALREIARTDAPDPPVELMARLREASSEPGVPPAASSVPASADTEARFRAAAVANTPPAAATPQAGQATPPSARVPPETPMARPERRARPRGEDADQEALRIAPGRLQRIAALAEDLQMAKIAMSEHFQDVQSLERQLSKLETLLQPWRNVVRGLRTQDAAASGLSQAARDALPALIQLRRHAAALGKGMRATLNRTSHLSAALQGDIRLLQLVPVANRLRPMARVVRDIGRELGKTVELHISGDQIEVDRAVLDGLRDPLMHLLRNAVDHGLETPDERRAAGKDETANIWLDVARVGGQVLLTVRDDGRGIDAVKIGEVALRKQLIQADELAQMDEQAMLALIFRPGFSSREAVTELSGRGVGLDVVMANLRKLKGLIRLDTVPGRGTTFTLELPLTLSTERGLHVRAGRENLLIPSTSVDRVVEVARREILEVAGSQALLLAGQPVPLRDLANTLELPAREDAEPDAALQVVVVSRGWSQVAFLVDEVVGEREIVIKQLPPPLHSVPNISGATLTGSGEIVMVLHIDDLAERALRDEARTVLPPLHDVQAESTAYAPHILVCDDSITTRTLQKNLLESKGYRVTLATDGQMGWELLQGGSFDVVVTDVEMPRLNGFELTERIRHSQDHTDLPVIIVSSLASEEDRLRGVNVGANAYIVKSEFESQAMLDALRQLI